MNVTGIDIETTGLEQAKGHRIIEIAMISVDMNPVTGDYTEQSRYVARINPERMNDPEAEAVHKISITELAGKPVWKTLAPEVLKRLKGTEILVAHNMAFDGPFIAAELLRIGLVPPTFPVFCTMENARWATGPGKMPKLQELAWSLGVEYDVSLAHAAEYDVLVTLDCLAKGVRRKLYDLPILKEAA